jgi:hypothetical protein
MDIVAGFAHWATLGHAPTTGENYLRCLRRLRTPLDQATPLDLTTHLAERAKEVGPHGLAIEVRALRAFYRWYADLTGCDNPARTLRTPKVPEPVVGVRRGTRSSTRQFWRVS